VCTCYHRLIDTFCLYIYIYIYMYIYIHIYIYIYIYMYICCVQEREYSRSRFPDVGMTTHAQAGAVRNIPHCARTGGWVASALPGTSLPFEINSATDPDMVKCNN
jgi:hypothetical protein